MTTEGSVSREIYPHAPLQLVAFELRTSHVPELGSREGSITLYELLREELPIIPPAPQALVGFQTAGVPPQFMASTPLQMLNRKRTHSVTVGPSLILIQTSDYTRFEDFRDFVGRVLTAVANVAAIAAVERVGLRYVDEIRIDGVEKPADWVPYINHDLLAAMNNPLGLESASLNTSVEFVVSDHQRATMRVGALQGRVIDPTGPLKLKSEADGPFFLVDLDSYWAPPVDELPPFAPESVLEIGSRLHEPARGLFESALSEMAREIFRGGGMTSGGT